ncbi:hypothetical protein [Massilia glaciei]|uniref:Uncharacterized protein n=1 Tax=Massilia glaciei TaxID=1524097 RepID=A0A2U2HLM6_9BURK|nr:hypothetical protein [Massilia glaciei]PWF48424.1 hypothetical protein C7C56_011940 [Massilia glaciei]
MKKLLCAITLLLGVCQASQAQVYFAPGSAKPLNPGAAAQDLNRQQAQPRPKVRRVVCRDGTRHTVRVCRRAHGGVR